MILRFSFALIVRYRTNSRAGPLLVHYNANWPAGSECIPVYYNMPAEDPAIAKVGKIFPTFYIVFLLRIWYIMCGERRNPRKEGIKNEDLV